MGIDLLEVTGFKQRQREVDRRDASAVQERAATERRAAIRQETREEGDVGTPSTKDFTVRSLAEYQQTGDLTSLVRYVDPLALRRVNQGDDRHALALLLANRPPPAALEKIIEDQISLNTLDQIVFLSDASYFGHVFSSVAALRKAYASRFGDEAQQGFLQFWREYDLWILEIRRKMFGTQFTPSEERIFDRIVATPTDSHRTGMRNIQQQRDMVNRARVRRISVLSEFRFDIPESILHPEGSVDPDAGVIDLTTK